MAFHRPRNTQHGSQRSIYRPFSAASPVSNPRRAKARTTLWRKLHLPGKPRPAALVRLLLCLFIVLSGTGTPFIDFAPSSILAPTVASATGVCDQGDLFCGKTAWSSKRHNGPTIQNGVDGDDATYATLGGMFQQLDYWVDLVTPQAIGKITLKFNAGTDHHWVLAGCTGFTVDGNGARTATGCRSFGQVNGPGSGGGVVSIDTHVYVPMRVWGVQISGSSGGSGSSYEGDRLYSIKGYLQDLTPNTFPGTCDSSTSKSDFAVGGTAYSTKSHDQTSNPVSQAVDGIDDSFTIIGGSFQQADLFVDMGTARVLTRFVVNSDLTGSADVQGCTGVSNGVGTGCSTIGTYSFTNGVLDATITSNTAYRVIGFFYGGNTFYQGNRVYSMKAFGNCTPVLPTAAEYRGGGSSLTSDPCGECGQPINSVTGNFYHTFTDLVLPTRSFPLQFERTYNAENATTNGVLGYGWTHSYNWFISRDVSNNYLVHEGNGAVVVFASDFSHPQRIMGTLATESGNLVLTRSHGRDRFYFTLAGSIYRLYKVVDRNGHITALSYNTSGLLQTVTDPDGRIFSFSYTSGKLNSVYDEDADRTVQFSYSSTTGDLTSVTDVAGKITSFTYTNHLLRTWTDPLGGVLTNDYSAGNQVVKQTDPMSRTLQFHYSSPSATGVVTTLITNTLGLVSKHYYVNNMLVRTLENPGPTQAITNYVYQAGTTKVAASTDANGRVWRSTWDSQGNLLSATDPLNRSVSFAYNSTNDVTVITSPVGLTTTFTYDANGNMLTSSRPYTEGNVSAITQLQYDPVYLGQVLTATTPIGTKWTYAYNSVGYLTSVTNPLNEKTQFAYTSSGWPQKATTPRNYSSQVMQFNAYGDPLVISDTRGYTTTYTYDNNRNVKTVTDANFNTTTYTYNLAGQVTRVTNPDSSHTDYGYDGLGRVITQTNALGQLTSYTHDDLGRRAIVTGPLTRTQTIQFDLVGNPTILTDTVGRTTKLAYDDAYQLRTMTYSDGVTPNVTYVYNNLGARTVMTDGTGTTTYAYDSLDRLISVKNGNAKTISYTYDLANRQTSITYPGSHTVTRTYNGANRIDTLSSWQYSASFEYDADGNLSYMITGNGDEIESVITNNPAGNVQEARHYVGSSEFLHQTYTRNKLGQVTHMADTQSTTNHTYTYDNRNRLASDTKPYPPAQEDETYEFEHDAGSRLSEYTYRADGCFYLSDHCYGRGALSYDGRNQLTQLEERMYDYITDPYDGYIVIEKNLTFGYDQSGNRTRRTDTLASPVVTTTYAYDQVDRLTNYNGQVQYRYNGDGLRMAKVEGATTEHFTWDVSKGVPLLIEDATSYYIYGPDGRIFEAIHKDQSQSRYTYFKDQLGSVRALVGPSGTVAATYQYDAYGNVTSSTGNVYNPFGYTGEYTDDESGLVYLRARYYDPETRQFLTVDPALASTEQPYAYVGGDPVNFVDPLGLRRSYSKSSAASVSTFLTSMIEELGGHRTTEAWVIGVGAVAGGAAGAMLAVKAGGAAAQVIFNMSLRTGAVKAVSTASNSGRLWVATTVEGGVGGMITSMVDPIGINYEIISLRWMQEMINTMFLPFAQGDCDQIDFYFTEENGVHLLNASRTINGKVVDLGAFAVSQRFFENLNGVIGGK